MGTFKNDVVEIKKETNKIGPFLVLKVRKEDGSIIEKKVFGAAVEDFSVPGLYEVVNEKNAKGFWQIDSATLLEAAQNGHNSPPVNPSQPTQPRAISRVHNVPGVSSAQIDTNRAILVQVCVKSACEVYHGAGASLGGKSEADAIALEKLVSAMAENLLKWADKKLSNHIEETPF